jgi:hypothetical protein
MESPKRKWTRLVWLTPVVVLALGGIAYAAMMLMPAPGDLDLALTRSSKAGLYRTTLVPGVDPLTVGSIHSWTIELETADGRPVEHAEIAVDGGMPQHGHGLPTSPKVTQNLGRGHYLVEGMKFNMPGWWTLTVHVDGAAGRDDTTFNLVL